MAALVVVSPGGCSGPVASYFVQYHNVVRTVLSEPLNIAAASRRFNICDVYEYTRVELYRTDLFRNSHNENARKFKCKN